MYQQLPPSTDPVLPSTNKYRPLLTQYHHVSTSTAMSMVTWGLKTSAQFTVGLVQGGITCGAIDEPRKSSKAIDERVIINFRDKYQV